MEWIITISSYKASGTSIVTWSSITRAYQGHMGHRVGNEVSMMSP